MENFEIRIPMRDKTTRIRNTVLLFLSVPFVEEAPNIWLGMCQGEVPGAQYQQSSDFSKFWILIWSARVRGRGG